MESEGTTAVPLRILIVENDQPIRDALAELLRTLGHETTPLGDYGKALILLEPSQFDLMLVSCGSTDLEGFGSSDLLTETKGLALAQIARAADPRLKIILAAASKQEGLNTERGSEVVDLVIAKPFTIRDLEKALAALFGR